MKFADLTGLRLLVVDDDDDMLLVLSESLKLLGAEVTTAATATEAMTAIRAQPVDVVISDLGMPEVDGLSLIGTIRELELGKPLAIALTGHARPEDAEASLAAGFDVHLAKPVTVQDLAETIQRLRER